MPCLIVIGAEVELGKLLRAAAREPTLGSRCAGTVTAAVLSLDELDPGTDSPLVVDASTHSRSGAGGRPRQKPASR